MDTKHFYSTLTLSRFILCAGTALLILRPSNWALAILCTLICYGIAIAAPLLKKKTEGTNPQPLAFAENRTLLLAIFTGLPALLLSFTNQWIGLSFEVMQMLHIIALISLIIYAVEKASLTTWILVSMAIGIAVGFYNPELGANLKVVSKIFLNLIKTIIAPLLFGTLVVGIAGHSNMGQVGRMGLKSIIYFEVVTTIALLIGLTAINLFPVGIGIEIPADLVKEEIKVGKQSWEDVLLHTFPENIAKSISEGQVLQIVVFSVMFGIAMLMVADRYRLPMLRFAESLTEVMFKFTHIVMYFAPFAVGAAIAYTVAKTGVDGLASLLQLPVLLLGSLLVFVFGVLLPIALVLKLPLRRFIKAVSEPVTLAFATSSSESALPKAMRAMESIGVPRKVVAFVMPLGYSFNLDGTTLYLALAAVFVAQAQGVSLSIGTQIAMMLTLMLTSKGVAGVSRASLVILLGTVASFNLSDAPVYLILGIDALMDMMRTSVNVMGNCLATVVVAKWEGEYDPNAPIPDAELPDAATGGH